jgi:ubiquinol-cytochrome c reductase cytochrome b subunit
MKTRVMRWLDVRLDLLGLERSLLKREVPDRLTWWHTLGSATLTVFLVQVATGSVLAVYYAASPDHAYDSIQYIETQVISGHVLRGIHHWAASAMVLLVLAHMMRVFVSGAYKYPREVNWLLGVGLFAVVLGFGFTGYLLPWDQKAYWATQVGTSIAGTMPLLGSAMVSLLRGGAQLGAATLTRFYALHVLWLPMGLGALILLHIALVIRQGIAPRPRDLESDGVPARTSSPTYGAYYKTAYAKTKRSGVRFWPDIIGKDAIVSLAIIAILVALGVFAGAGLDAPADPTDTSYVPLPEWYFLPFYQLLKLVPGALESAVAVGIPAALILVLLLLPLFDRRSQRSLSHRPVAMGTLAFVLVSCALLLGAALRGRISNEPVGDGPPLTLAARTGRSLFKQQQCGACHAVTGKADAAAIAPDLSAVGLRHSAGWMHSFMESPAAFHPGSIMPAFGPPTLSHSEIEEMAQYLASLRGVGGRIGAPNVHDTFPPIPGATNKQEASR